MKNQKIKFACSIFLSLSLLLSLASKSYCIEKNPAPYPTKIQNTVTQNFTAEYTVIESSISMSTMSTSMNNVHYIRLNGNIYKWAEVEGWITNKCRNRKIKTVNGNRGGGIKHTLKIVHWNAGGSWWEAKKEEIEALIFETEPDLLFISEANLRLNTPSEQKDIQGYYMLTPNTHIHMGYSRILLLAREGVKLEIMDECMDPNLPSIWVKLITRGKKPMIIGGLYREFHHLLQTQPNNTDEWSLQVGRWKKTLESWKKATKNCKSIIIGDLNIDFLQWSEPSYRGKKLVQMMKNEIETSGFCQLITSFTRSWPGVPSTIVDHIWTDSPESIMSTSNTVRSASDHNVITAVLRTKNRKLHVHDITKRNMKNFNLTTYRNKIQAIDWREFYSSQDINVLNDIFVRKVGDILEEVAPLKTYQYRKNFKNWVTPELKNQMELRDLKRERARITNDPEKWKEYRTERNSCTKNLLKVKTQHHKELFEKFEKTHDTKNIYNTARRILNWGGAEAPQTLISGGLVVRRPVDLANCQMDYFVEKVRKLTNNLPQQGHNPLRWLNTAMSKWKNRDSLQQFSFKELSLQDTVKIIGSLGNSTSFGVDEIDALAIKAAVVHLAPPLRHMVNVSLSTSKFANRWKLSKLLPLLKSTDANKLLPSSYRPIAILPTTSKIIEKAAQAQILQHMEKNQLLNDNTHAYRAGYSTTTALLEISEELFKAVNEKKISTIMTLDQSSAFDCVQHEILLKKLKCYKMDATVIEWVKSYLEHRTQFVSIGNARSAMHPMDRGVPQGSVLGPLLYSIFTNEMAESIKDPECQDQIHQQNERLFTPDCDKCGQLIQYADDANYHIASKDRVVIKGKLSQNLSKIGEFLSTNQLTINKDKTHMVEIMIKQKRGRIPPDPPPPELQVLNSKNEIEIIRNQEHCRILGLNFQHNLTWKSHLEHGSKPLLPSLRKNLGALKHIGKLIPRGSRNTLARGLIISRLSYLIGIWGGATPNLLRRAQAIQNMAARWITNNGRRARTSILMEQTGWFSIEETIKLSSANTIWKIIHMKTPRKLHDKLSWDQNTLKFNILQPRIEFTKSNFSYRACTEWNQIPDAIRNIKSIGSFKKHMKTWTRSLRPRMPD